MARSFVCVRSASSASGLIDERGFVRLTPDLRLLGHRSASKLGAQPSRRVLAHDVRAKFDGRPLRSYRPSMRRWGSVIGIQSDGLGSSRRTAALFRFAAWSFHHVLMPWIVRWGIYRGVREQPRGGEAAISE
jgi:apoptosis-inducing factor 2